MALTVRQSLITWSCVAAITAVLLLNGGHTDWIPQSSLAERLLVWMCFVSVLGRCILLGVFVVLVAANPSRDHRGCPGDHRRFGHCPQHRTSA